MILPHISTPPTVPLEVGANPNDSFDTGSIDVEVSELTAHDELCIQNIFDRQVPFVLVPRVRKESFSFDHDMRLTCNICSCNAYMCIVLIYM